MKSKGEQKENPKDKQCSIQKPTKVDELKKMFPNAPDEMIKMLLEQSNNVFKHPNKRRWPKEFVVTCLQLFNKNPRYYEMLSESKMIALTSKAILIMYRNALKQTPGYDQNVFQWMHEEACRKGIKECERLGGVSDL